LLQFADFLKIGQALAGAELGIVESIIFTGISLAVVVFWPALFVISPSSAFNNPNST
jgi:hypothetical protein